MAESTSPTTEDESLMTNDDNTIPSTTHKPELKPIKSALRSPPSLNESNTNSNSKPPIKRTVTFVPGLISGKSDILQIGSDEEQNRDNNSNNNNINNFLFADDDEDENNDNLVLISDESELNFTNWRFGNTFSGSETSDDEKNFDAMNKKYQQWSPQFMKNKKRKEKMDQTLKTSIKKLRATKQNIKKLRVEITDNSNEESDSENENKNKNNKNNKNRGRIRRSHKRKLNIENNYKKWKKRENKKGVIYISSVPFGCTSVQLKKIFTEFGDITNVYLEAAKGENGKVKKIHNKWTEFCEGWIEFKDKKIAKQVVELLHETKIPKKYVKNRLARNHIWNMKYLRGFGWHHLDEYKNTVRTLQRKKYEIKIADAQRQSAYFESQVAKAKEIMFDMGGGNGGSGGKQQVFESSDEGIDCEEPPLKKQRVVRQKCVRKRRNHRNKQVLDKLMK